MMEKNNDDGFFNLVSIVFCLIIILLLAWWSVGCTSNHYFSINAEEMTNPKIEYHDSTTLTNPF